MRSPMSIAAASSDVQTPCRQPCKPAVDPGDGLFVHSTGITGATGPNVSSVITRIAWFTLVNTCGAKYGVPGLVGRKYPRINVSHCSLTDCFGDLSANEFRCAVRTIGPSVVSGRKRVSQPVLAGQCNRAFDEFCLRRRDGHRCVRFRSTTVRN